MFTAQGAQMPIYQISCKSSDFFAYTQEKRAKVHFQLRFSYNFLAESPIGWISGG